MTESKNVSQEVDLGGRASYGNPPPHTHTKYTLTDNILEHGGQGRLLVLLIQPRATTYPLYTDGTYLHLA